MMDHKSQMLGNVAEYYSERLRKFGATAKGVDWNDPKGQFLRFEQLGKLVLESRSTEKTLSITDYGCGYGAFLEYIRQSFSKDVEYEFLGLDVSAEMIEASRQRWLGDERARFIVGSQPDQKTDFAVASGIFNVCLKADHTEWLDYILETLTTMARFSNKGFAFNCLTSYSDEDKKADHLFYADPCYIFDYCKSNFSRNVALLHDYDLYEFTILVRQ
ncbi:class I SAM-dependent methyltransferase [Sneathiella litorea]|uniref:Methyltransferase domain-containing protein n=1 Tax=Sneathiella litorea TaxID=2606216 RepID=A0A6L8W810_9PROT|nr:class I SAM-dependent methyltransferase [Sneathiella litorea]MZR30632.1 methyltransferase domain-containing protein [Sneathiella litorea]